ncbi:hypothetical protein KKC32_02625 [Patescibacteria group bacterium]|nr:hypothetical protein [Patescibacteria group bacterium]
MLSENTIVLIAVRQKKAKIYERFAVQFLLSDKLEFPQVDYAQAVSYLQRDGYELIVSNTVIREFNSKHVMKMSDKNTSGHLDLIQPFSINISVQVEIILEVWNRNE